MKKIKTLLAGVTTSLVLTASTWASPQTVTLNVSGMTCAACPITVKKARGKIPGVSKVEVRFEKKQVLVTFDDAKTNTDDEQRPDPLVENQLGRNARVRA